MGQSPNSNNYTSNPKDYILVQGNADMKNGQVYPRVWTTEVTKTASKGDLILSVRAPVGDVGKTGYDVVIGRGVAAIQGNEFIYQLLRQMKAAGYWTRFSTGSTFESINSFEIHNAVINLPDKHEQIEIGKLLLSFDRIITLHEEKKHQLERLKSALLQKMFADKSGYPAVRFKKYNSAWVLRRIIDLLNQAITDGPHETPCLVGKGIPFISADAIVNNKIDFSRKRGNITKEYDLECCKKYRPQMHDIYLVKSGSTVGKVAIVETTTRFNIWSPLAALRCGEKSDPYFVFFLMQTEKFQTQVKNKASNGTQPNLSMRALERFKVIVSIELNEQQAIGNLFKKMNELIDLYQHKIDNLIAVKQWLLQNMFI